jgi:hypothetical protein
MWILQHTVLLKLRDAIRRKCPAQMARVVLLHHDNVRPHMAWANKERIQEILWELLEQLPYSPDFAPSDFHLFDLLKNHLGGSAKRFIDDEEVETEVWKWLRQLICCRLWHTGKAMGEVYQCWWRVCREINILSRFGYYIFYILYTYVTYLLTLPRIC